MSDDAAAKRRAKQTLINLLLSLAATSAIVLALVLAVPRSDTNLIKPVDYVSVAQSAATSSGKPVLVPELLGQDWWSNSARWNNSSVDGVANWYVGFVGPKNQYLGLTQAFDSNPTWMALKLGQTEFTGKTTIGGLVWEIYQNPEVSSPPKTMDYVMVTNQGADQIFIYGTASKTEFRQFAQLVQAQIAKIYQ
ncbi:MAG: DUF4245 domain-containing protein [Micrococcales bacterium]